jgi:hypothetical protein
MTINRTILAAALVALGTGGSATAGMLYPSDGGFGPSIDDGRSLDLNLAALNEDLRRSEPPFGHVALGEDGAAPDFAEAAVRPIEARAVALGSVTGVAYYTVERDGLRVVTTLADGATGTPVRLEATLGAGESVVLSTPGAAVTADSRVEITRVGDAIEVRDGALTN